MEAKRTAAERARAGKRGEHAALHRQTVQEEERLGWQLSGGSGGDAVANDSCGVIQQSNQSHHLLSLTRHR